MATTVTRNGANYSVPAYGDSGWAQGTGNLSSYLINLATGGIREVYIAGTPLNNYTGSLTLINLVNKYVANGQQLSFYINGLLQDVTNDYVETSTTSITVNSPLNTGDRLSFRWG